MKSENSHELTKTLVGYHVVGPSHAAPDGCPCAPRRRTLFDHALPMVSALAFQHLSEQYETPVHSTGDSELGYLKKLWLWQKEESKKRTYGPFVEHGGSTPRLGWNTFGRNASTPLLLAYTGHSHFSSLTLMGMSMCFPGGFCISSEEKSPEKKLFSRPLGMQKWPSDMGNSSTKMDFRWF